MNIPFGLAPNFQSGCSFLMSKANFLKYQNTYLGPDGYKFVVPTDELDDLLAKYPNDPRMWEEKLGLDYGSLGDGDVVRGDITGEGWDSHLVAPKKGMPGVNEKYKSHNYVETGEFPQTSGGKSEAVLYKWKNDDCNYGLVKVNKEPGILTEADERAKMDDELNAFEKAAEQASDEEIPDVNQTGQYTDEYTDEELKNLEKELDEELKVEAQNAAKEAKLQEEAESALMKRSSGSKTETSQDTTVEETEEGTTVTKTTTVTTTTTTTTREVENDDDMGLS